MMQRQGVNMKVLMNRLLVCASVILFVLNTWLVKTLLTVTSELDALHAGVDSSKETSNQIQDDLNKQIWPSDSKPQLCASSSYIDRDKAIVLGQRKQSKDFLTIAIPTVKRSQESYLQQTLDSLIENTRPAERATITIVIFLANLEEEVNSGMKVQLESTYQGYFREGFMQLVVAPPSFYPSFDDLKQNFGDSKERVLWRAKQVVDYAFLFMYCQGLAEYYLQLEDDVISSPDFVQSIREFLEVSNLKKWTTLEFSELGFIGKLIRSSELSRLAQFALFFYEDQPVDYLLKYYNHLTAQEGTFRRAPSIFQHIGMQSSLHNKEQELIDHFFEANSVRKYLSHNPPAVLYSSMETFSMYVPQLAYSSKPGYFWGKTPITGDTVLVVFEAQVRLSRVVIETGSDTYPDDFLRSGKLEASPVVSLNGGSTPRCRDYIPIADFSNGIVDAGDLEAKLDFESKCIQVTVTKSQQQWLLMREIAVWVRR